MNTEQREALENLIQDVTIGSRTQEQVLSDLHTVRPLLQGLLDGPQEAKGSLYAISEALGLFASAIKSGEPWTGTCEAVKDKAWRGLSEVSSALVHLDFELRAKDHELEIANGEIERLNDGGGTTYDDV